MKFESEYLQETHYVTYCFEIIFLNIIINITFVMKFYYKK